MNESEVRGLLAKGKPVVFPSWGDRSDAAERTSRTVDADWIAALIDPDGTCSRQIQIDNAVIVGDLVLRGMTFRRYVIFRNCDFEGRVILNLSHLNLSLLLRGCVLKGEWQLRGTQIDGSCEFILCAFERPATFSDMAVKHTVNGSGSTFGSVNFERMTVGKSLRFRVSRDDGGALVAARFRDSVRFLDAVVNGTAEFDGAQFLDVANFTRFRVTGDAFFRAATTDDDLRAIVGVQPAVRFAGDAYFVRARVDGDVEFGGATFEKEASFRRAQILGDLAMNRGVQFKGGAEFLQVRVSGKANFTGARFAALANFELADVGSVALFRSANALAGTTTFGGEARFVGAVMRAADFRGAKFCGPANFARMKLADDIQFSALSLPGTADEVPTVFERDGSFLNATIGGVFDFVDVRVAANLDFSGMTFGRIAGDWRPLLKKQRPYDRHPYAEFESFFRAAGNDREASHVYLERREREFAEMREKLRKKGESWWPWLARAIPMLPDLALQLFHRHALRYGIRPLRLLLFSAFVIALGSRIFAQVGAVSPKGSVLNASKVHLHTWEAFRYSVKLFVPGVDVQAGDWVPSNQMMPSFPMSFEAYGAVHRFAGIILLPLGIAALAGLLVPKERSGG